MRRDPLHFAVLSVLLVLGGRALVAEQQRADNIQSDTLSHSHCRSGSDEADKPSGPEFSLADIKFLGSLRLPVVEQDQIAASVKQQTHGDSAQGAIDEALERVRAGSRDRGFSKS